MIRVAILLFLCAIGNSNEDGDWLKCKPKPGCSIASCDPSPGHGFENLDKLNDYSILCQKNEPSDDTDAATNYAKVLEKLTKLEGRLERSEREGREIKAEMKILERKTARMQNQMEKVEKEVNELRKGSCAITFNGICYWTHFQDEQNVNFTRAEEICSNKASTPAQFPNEEVYNAVVEDVRSKIPSRRRWVRLWTGVTIDTNTGNVIHPSRDTYVKWVPGNPYTGSSHKTWTQVVLLVNTNSGSISQGMFNRPPQGSYLGVVCQNVE